ncbi:hypothetical protein ACI4CD_29420, partial [Klebsiella pneumoniae]|uniref:hypothetical protein n=1 Tax=Klebsiella pneumoniae TaxID=573 RepID=UPI0038535C17
LCRVVIRLNFLNLTLQRRVLVLQTFRSLFLLCRGFEVSVQAADPEYECYDDGCDAKRPDSRKLDLFLFIVYIRRKQIDAQHRS